MLQTNDTLHLPVFRIDDDDGVAAGSSDVKHSALIVHDQSTGSFNAPDLRDHAALDGIEDVHGIRAVVGDDEIAVDHDHVVESGSSGQVERGNLSQRSG